MSEQNGVNWQSLLEAAQDGDRQRQNELVEALRVRIRLVIQYRCWGWSLEDQEDILQESLAVFWEKLDSIRDHPITFALQIARNKIGDALRKHRGRRDVFQDDGHDPVETRKEELDESTIANGSNNIGTDIELEEIVSKFRRAIPKLTPYCQTLFMGLLEGKNVNDMWEFFSSLEPNLSRLAFDTRNTRCRQKLLMELKKQPVSGRGNQDEMY